MLSAINHFIFGLFTQLMLLVFVVLILFKLADIEVVTLIKALFELFGDVFLVFVSVAIAVLGVVWTILRSLALSLAPLVLAWIAKLRTRS